MSASPVLRGPWWRWLAAFAFWTLLGLAFAGQLYLSRSKVGDPVSWSFAFKRAFADWYGYGALSVPALWLARQFQLGRDRWRLSLVVHLAGSAAFSVAWMLVRAGLEQGLTRDEMFPTSFAAAFSRALVATFFLNVLIYWFIVVVWHAAHSYGELHRRELHTAELEARLTTARLQALQMQLNPHFLFNTLNSISSLMHKDVEAADRMLVRLSDLLRYALESTDAQEVLLRQELGFLDGYLEIQRARFGERLAVEQQVEPAALDALLPNLLLQPLVENAICHGIAPHARPGRIVLRARQLDGRLALEVEDNGGGIPAGRPPVDGVGLANTRARLQQLYGKAHEFLLLNAPSGGLLVRILVPWHEAPAPEAPPARLASDSASMVSSPSL
jgi:signal transduction histidine kinase